MQPICAELSITSVSRKSLDLRASINTCEPGRRGDSVAPANGLPIGEFRVGRGVYFQKHNAFHPGIAVERAFTQRDAKASIVLYFFTDGTTPERWTK